VVTSPGGDPINGSSVDDDVDQPIWPFKLLFQAPVDTHAGKSYYQNFYTSPAGALINNKLYLAWGSAYRQDLPYIGPNNIDDQNRLYVVFDPDPLELAPPIDPMDTDSPALGTVDEGDLVDATSSPGGVSITAGKRGFFIKGAEGEKFVTNTVIFAGLVITSSFTPTPSADPCAARGDAQVYVFDLLTGEGYFTDAGGNPERKLDIGVGLPTDPRVSVGVGGTENRVYIEKSGADLESFGAPNIRAGGRLLYWREMP
jgi:hypothetical protein